MVTSKTYDNNKKRWEILVPDDEKVRITFLCECTVMMKGDDVDEDKMKEHGAIQDGEFWKFTKTEGSEERTKMDVIDGYPTDVNSKFANFHIEHEAPVIVYY